MLQRETNLPSTPPQAPASQAVTGQAQKRALRRLLRDLITFTGTAMSEVAAKPRKARASKRQRLLYRRADTLTDADLAALVREVGIDRIWRVVDRLTQPSLPLIAAE
jgi:hypothetical protein